MSWRAISWARKRRTGSPIGKAVLLSLALHADDKGFCWPSQETISNEIECSVDSVQRALKKLVLRNLLLRIKRKSSDGRRISDAYQLDLDNRRTDPPMTPRDPAPCAPVSGGGQAAMRGATEPQMGLSPEGTERLKYLKEIIHETSYCRLIDTKGGGRLAARLGMVVFDTWFRNVTFIEERDQLLVLEAESKFIADRIEQQFERAIVQCFRFEHSEALRVKVLVRKDESGK